VTPEITPAIITPDCVETPLGPLASADHANQLSAETTLRARLPTDRNRQPDEMARQEVNSTFLQTFLSYQTKTHTMFGLFTRFPRTCPDRAARKPKPETQPVRQSEADHKKPSIT